MIEKAILIRSNETDKYLQLGWWNIDNGVPDIDGAKYIFVHNGKGNATGVYKLSNVTSFGQQCAKPYAELTYTDGKETWRRVNFWEFAKNLDSDWFGVQNLPIYKQGQGTPIMVANVDTVTKTIV